MTLRKLVLASALTVVVGVGVVYGLSYAFKPSPSSLFTGTLSVSAYCAVKQPDGKYEGSYVQAPVTVAGSESYNGTTTTDTNNPLNFTLAPGQYSVSGTYNDATAPAVTVNVSTGSHVKILLNFASPPLSPTAEGVSDGFELTVTLPKTEYNFGEPVNVTLTLTNVSNQTTEFLFSDRKNFDFRVYNSTHPILFQWWTGLLSLNLETSFLFSPGESLGFTLIWPQMDLAENPVSPGTYYIVGRIGGPVFDETNSTIETTPIQITIVPQ